MDVWMYGCMDVWPMCGCVCVCVSDVVVQWALEQEMFNGLITVGAVDTLLGVLSSCDVGVRRSAVHGVFCGEIRPSDVLCVVG